jgi:hypothetical protein
MSQSHADQRTAGVRQLGALLACFDGPGTAAKSLRPLESRLRSDGQEALETTVLKVDAKHRASVYDRRRTLMGTLTSALTWGLFGLVTGGLDSAAIWAILGAVCGGLFAYLTEHVLTKTELVLIGGRLPARSSALLTFAETTDPKRLLGAAGSLSPTAASAVGIADDLTAHVFAGSANPVEVPGRSADQAILPDENTVLSMIVFRYPGTETAKQVAGAIRAASTEQGASTPVELVISTARNGRRHVGDPTHGVAAFARSDVISWGAFGLVFGAIVGAVGGGGVLGFVDSGVITGVAWAAFGLAAGALYGLWAGRSISARRLRSIGRLLPPETSALVAWGEGPLRPDTLAAFARPDAERLVLRFNPVGRGAVLEAD